MTNTTPPPLRPGIYVPTLAFFHPDTEDLDLPTTTTHATSLLNANVPGLVVQGSNGEAVHLTPSERNAITRTTRDAITAHPSALSTPLIVGCGAASTRETIQLCRDAAASGGDYVLILPPAYYKSLLTREHILAHFRAVADASPLPVLLYNFPAAAGGVDLSSDEILSLAEHGNIVGVKLTCGDTGKLARVAAGVQGMEKGAWAGAGAGAGGFRVFGGSADFTLQTLVAGGDGVIGGVANLIPRLCVRVMELYGKGEVDEARRLQAVVARADWQAIKGGFVAVKAALQVFRGYGGPPRRPCVGPGVEQVAVLKEALGEAMELEWDLERD
ncbi:dihydrodipicolinate synthetase family protein [Aspergillus heteromorphus CBS 117.55]|uniref:Dihydrodipicolinate synthetase family protein n=1 Tax=Aspergillus heteromorphus CBS 117.55 TaxID=1448321 RepID=A0A317WVH7_9EURO|nr:dihydrodipicolinate synthetase family protein [Aspergillus heteromorphus CBS 117.55]PWY89302.1 dihydrodipicolinate synthetase family protein [Aspergillus heteromorphus CBS 117.55]